jgi:radical SAM superfamily enzyme YgiQ (UPF0313 family)
MTGVRTMKKLKVLFLQVGLRAYNHFQYSPCTTFALLSGLLKKNCPAEIDDILVVDGSIKFKEAKEIVNTLDDYKPDVVGLRCFSFNHKLLMDFVSLIKDHNPHTTVIVGGPHATVEHRKLMQDKNIDFAVIGEGEETICELIKALSHYDTNVNDIKGIAFKDNGQVVVTDPRPLCSDLSEVYSSIDHECINYDDYEGLLSDMPITGKEGRIMTSRGCPYRCAYCHGLSGQRVRRRNIEEVMKEIEYLVKNKGLKYFRMDDDIFNIDRPWAKQFTRTLIERQYGIKISFYNGLRGDQMDEELIDLLIAAGTYHFRFAVETASPRIQKLIRKNLNIDKTMLMIKYVANTPVFVDAFFILGFPSETEEDLESTQSFIEQSGIFHPVINFLQISPHTHMQKLYEQYAARRKAHVLTSDTGGTYHKITDNGFCYTLDYLKKKYQDIAVKTFSDPQKIAVAYDKLSHNLKPEDTRIYFGLRYGFPNSAGIKLDNLPHNELGDHLKKVAKEAIPLVMKGLGYLHN